ncbi:MAG: hypothetical protein ACREQX_06410 [Candidatus Binataceae bacterium]
MVRSINTGDAHTEYTPIGHSTSLASRMQTLAPTGSIAVTEAARPHAHQRRDWRQAVWRPE